MISGNRYGYVVNNGHGGNMCSNAAIGLNGGCVSAHDNVPLSKWALPHCISWLNRNGWSN